MGNYICRESVCVEMMRGRGRDRRGVVQRRWDCGIVEWWKFKYGSGV